MPRILEPGQGAPFRKDKDFARVTPPILGAIYEQQGRLYRADGRRVLLDDQTIDNDPGPEVDPRSPESVIATLKKNPALLGELATLMREQGLIPDAAPASPAPAASSATKANRKVGTTTKKAAAKRGGAQKKAAAPKDATPPVPPTDAPPADPGEIDLKAWATSEPGALQIPFKDVRAAFKAQFDDEPEDEEAAVEILLSEGIVTNDDVKVLSETADAAE